MKLIKVLHIGETVKGGIAGLLNELLPLQSRDPRYSSVSILCPSDQVGEIDVDGAVHVMTFRRGRRSVRSLIRFFVSVWNALRHERADIIHLHSFFAGLIVRIMPRSRHAVLVYCPHGWAFQRETSSVAKWLSIVIERLLASRSNLIVCVSENERFLSSRYGIAARRIAVVHNGVRDIAAGISCNEHEWIDSRLKALFIGRFDHQKGVDILIRAIDRLSDRVALRVIGENVLSSRRLDFPKGVEVFGWMAPIEVAGHIARADVIVMPSRWEGLPMVAIEAARAGKPVLGARVGGLPEVVLDGRTGILFEPGDADHLVTAFEAALGSDLDALGRRARERYLQEFDAVRTHERLTDCYREALARSE